ncbi:hypothetical protein MLD38_008485 [Melastoma candidum]|uniref:Uncharacterized protein n=1 Tax=Melastoma candidum TaxID=119954 RepID=A0ACB9RVR1_9MYRT|nr:hypothetical protein MLD38_008485 [Melastoma candidum]
MECNKDEATRAREIAEKKFLAKDMAGAKKFALKAQSLYPGLEGISQMIATLDVYISAENKIFGESDWYGILGVGASADDETVRKQYRRLALMLHPDKNKSVGAEGAFKYVSEAWSLLSDREKRAAYDRKRNQNVFCKAATSNVGNSSVPPPRTNGFGKSTVPNTKNHKSNYHPKQSSQKTKQRTFWTVCHRCKMQYEYLRVYLNHNLLCPNCQKPFFAIEIAPPVSNVTRSSTAWNFSQQQHAANHHPDVDNTGRNRGASMSMGTSIGHDSYAQTNFSRGAFSRNGASSAAQAATVVQQAYEKVKREREEAQAATKREEAIRRKNASSKRSGGIQYSGQPYGVNKRRRDTDDMNGSSYMRESGLAGVSCPPASQPSTSEHLQSSGISNPAAPREVSSLDLQSMLMKKAREEIGKKLGEWRSSSVPKGPDKEDRNESGTGIEKVKKVSVVENANNGDESRECRDGEAIAVNDVVEESAGAVDDDTSAENLDSLIMNVPDPDFHDFDKDRSEKSFGAEQVWAAYDNDDGMPRYYALVHDVISSNPFKVRISWLNSKTNNELGPMNWVTSGFSKTCGEFRVGKHEINRSLNSFSHRVRWTKGVRGVICIYPRKGDVWALYRNWSPEWNELTADDTIHCYDMVEVLEDYDEEEGVLIVPLVKVAGFKTVFHRHLDIGQVRRIPREEMFRFSHHVPSFLLTGQEGANAPKGCRELDPAATPLELLDIIFDAKVEDKADEQNGTVDEDQSVDSATNFKPVLPKPEEVNMFENPR